MPAQDKVKEALAELTELYREQDAPRVNEAIDQALQTIRQAHLGDMVAVAAADRLSALAACTRLERRAKLFLAAASEIRAAYDVC